MRIKAARAVGVQDNPLLHDVVLTLDGGRIAGVAQGGPCDLDLGDVLLVPGLINLHTHLELTHTPRPPLPADGFVGWVKTLPLLDETQAHAAIEDGLRQSAAFGVTTVLSVGRHAWPHRNRDGVQPTLDGQGCRLLQAGEIITVGRNDGQVRQQIEGGLKLDGLEPHAPYTVDAAAYKRCASAVAASEMRKVLTTHAAEHPFEAQFLAEQAGPLVELMKHFRIPRHAWPTGATPLQQLRKGGVLAEDAILVHANFIDDADLPLLGSFGGAIVYCPRTHAFFAYDDIAPHPWAALEAMGVNVCLGTDSAASAGDLDLMKEARVAWQGAPPSMSADMLLQMITTRPARALGLHDQLGQLSPGFLADMVAYPATSAQHLLQEPMEPAAVFIAGRRVV